MPSSRRPRRTRPPSATCTSWIAPPRCCAGVGGRLGPADIEDLNRLYQLGFRAGFATTILDDAVYFGVRVRGRLVSAAGTHVLNRSEGIAVVGNVRTHADYRGHDFAKMVTSAVTAELLDRV